MAWTPEQQKAIDTRDRTLLVSAAAGSGKTATLTERIIRSILDEENPIDISRMLIATYTNAAVDELRERIGKAIKKAVLENPGNSRLEEQLLRLGDAKILTITSFCNSILRASAENAGLPPNYRIAEPPEAKILSSAVLEGLINAAYEGELPEVASPEDFIELADCLSNVKHSEGLSEAISFIFDKLTYSEGGIDTLGALIEEYNPESFIDADRTRYGKYIMALAREAFSAYEKAYESVIRSAAEERVDEKNLPKAVSDLEYIKRCLAAEEYESLRETINTYSPERLSRSGKDPVTDFYAGFKALRSNLGSDIKKFASSFFVYTNGEWRELYIKLYKLLGILYRFLKKYYEVFMNEKRRRGICEFSDVERYAYDALYNSDGTVTPLARELRSKFDAIYVDEYQDVNGLQSKVFSAISKENNRFMVGDIKQSIYCFRSARPEIFAKMKDEFPLLGREGDYPAASIFMSNNFRCDEAVVDFVNGVFDTMFGLLGENIGYIPEDRLKFSKIYPEGSSPTRHIPEIHIIEKPSKKNGAEEDPIEAALEEDMTSAQIEASYIADKISELIGNERLADGSPIEARHIAILMRSVRGSLAEAISDALKARGIASSIAETGDLFMCEEVLLALSFLYCIDNPHKDIYLTAVMLSPIFGFTADEILKIRKSSKSETLWDALLDYAAGAGASERAKDFIAAILRYRKLAEGQPTDALLSLIYRESGLFALASNNGGRENLILLHSYARKYEGTDFKGLYSFISYINAIIERGEEFPSASLSDESNSVRIMTVHKSKGLEFPVTIIAGASSGGKGDRGGKIVFSDNFGISIKTKDDTGLAIVDNPTCHAISNFIKNSEFDEELRVLYVALTRARERLYVYAMSPKALADEYISETESMREILSPYFARKAKSFLDIIMLGRQGGKVIIESRAENESGVIDASFELESVEADSLESDAYDSEIFDTESLREEFLRRFNFKYPLSHLETVPEKISVSKLSPTILDDSADNGITLEELLYKDAVLSGEVEVWDEEEEDSPPTLPEFITGISARESAKRGIATHTVLQFCDFEKLESSGAKAELQRLVLREFLSEEDRERVRVGEIEKFIRSPLFHEIRHAKKLYRELRFNVKLPAEKFTEDKEKKKLLAGSEVLVQGVIDCLIENEDGSLHLVDYKTDRLTRDELQIPELGEERLRLAHTRQLSYYSDAVKTMFGKAPEKIGIYSLHLGKEISILI